VNVARRRCVLVNQRGLHARASARFVARVAELADGTTVEVSKDGQSAGGGSILGLMMLGAAKGNAIELVVTGPDAEAVADELEQMVIDGFGED
jgi:phosphocarrier protein